MKRRSFLAAPLAAQLARLPVRADGSDERVIALGDGVPLSPSDYAKLLTKLADSAEPDDYSRGGVVEKLEARMAAALGKEIAVWLPTGTLANHLAVRLLAGQNRRVIVQAESHLYNDSGDCAQTLSGLNLIPLASGKAGFTLDDAERSANVAMLGRVATPVGAVQIESPVRRRAGEQFDFGEMTRISGWARDRKIGLHLDGARLFIESVYTKRPLTDYAKLFDTVYISMYKYFNAGSGAVLAGPKSLLGDLYGTRRMFGGGLPHVWQYAAVALHYTDGWKERFQRAVEASERVKKELGNDSNFEITPVANGTNVFRMRVPNVNAPVYHIRLEQAGITASAPGAEGFTLQVNETWARVPPAEIVGRFRKALG